LHFVLCKHVRAVLLLRCKAIWLDTKGVFTLYYDKFPLIQNLGKFRIKNEVVKTFRANFCCCIGLKELEIHMVNESISEKNH